MTKKYVSLRTALAAGTLAAVLTGGCTVTDERDAKAVTPVATVIKSPVDSRDYRYIELDNGLKALLISDPATDKAAAAVDVNVGSFQDPDDRLGLAHFLEHMLFMGSEKYPDVDGYHEFIRANGGFANAYTMDYRTNYYFDVTSDSLRPALDQLAQFFVAPTLDPAYVDRERNAVDSEYRLHAKEDFWRLYMAQSATSNPEHPGSRFTIGDLDTLNNDDGKSLWQDLKDFHDKYYVAPNIGVVVYGRESTDELETWVQKSFRDVPAAGGVKPDTSIGLPPYTEDQLGVRINQVPLKETRVLSLNFPLESIQPHYRIKPVGYLSRIIGYEGAGSLHSYLKEQGLIDSLATMPVDVPGEYSEFIIRMELTPKGLGQVDEITAIVFDYLALVREEGIQERLYEEAARISDLGFRYQENRKPQQTASALAARLHYLPPEHLLKVHYLFESFDKHLIERFMNGLTPDNLRQVVIARELPTDRVEPYFQTRYSIQPLSRSFRERLAAPVKHAELTIPEPNRFIARDLELRPGNKGDQPTLLLEQEGMRVWSMTDSSFEVPRASVRLKISTAKASASEKDVVLLDLYRSLLSRSLNEYGYPALEAGLNYGLSASREGLVISMSGYQDKQSYLLETILDSIDEFKPVKAEFEQERDRLVRALRNKEFMAPFRSGMDRISQLLYPRYYSDNEMLAAAKKVSFTDLEAYAREFYQSVHLEMLIYGNHSRKEAEALATLAGQRLLTEANRGERYEQPFNTLKEANIREAVDFDHNDALFIRYQQFDTTDNHDRARFALLGRLLSSPFFNQLRTEQQLGYIVNAGARPVQRHPGLIFTVQSPVLGPEGIEERVDAFMREQVKRIAALTEKELADYRQSLVVELTRRDANPDERAARFWHSLDGQEGDFNYNQRIARAVEAITVEDIQAAMAEAMKGTGVITITSKGKVNEQGS